MRTEDVGKVADTAENRTAGAFLIEVRKKLGYRQADMAAQYSERLGLHFSTSAVAGWETGSRTVPGPILVVALDLAGRPLGPVAEIEPDKLAALEGEIQDVGGMLAEAIEAMIEGRRASQTERLLDLAKRVRARLAEPEGD